MEGPFFFWSVARDGFDENGALCMDYLFFFSGTRIPTYLLT